MGIYINTCGDCGVQFESDKNQNTCPDCSGKGTVLAVIVIAIAAAIFVTIGNVLSLQTVTRYGFQTWWSNIVSLQIDQDLFLKDSFALLTDTDRSASANLNLSRGICVINKGEVEVEEDNFVAVEFYSNRELRYGFIELPAYESVNAELATDKVCPQSAQIEQELERREQSATLAAMREQLSIEYTDSEEAAARTRQMDAFYSVSELSNDVENKIAWVPKEQESVVEDIRSTYSSTYSAANNQDLFYQSNLDYSGVLSQ